LLLTASLAFCHARQLQVVVAGGRWTPRAHCTFGVSGSPQIALMR
jgi:hypothetical protein